MINSEIKMRQIRVNRVNESTTNPDGTVTVTKGNVYEERPFRSVENIVTFLKTDPEYSTKLKYNLFTDYLEYDGKRLSEERINLITNNVERNLGFYSPTKVKHAIDVITGEKINAYHPIKDYLDSLVWDGKSRVETMFIDWFNTDDSPLTRAYAKTWMKAAIKRVMEPGCKFDNVLLFINDPNASRSTFCQQLTNKNVHISIGDIKNNREYAPLLNLGWICSVNEAIGKTKKQLEWTREMFFKNEDTFMPFFEKNYVTYKRHCVFTGWTHNEEFLKYNSLSPDSKYWIIDCSDTDESYIFYNFTDEIVNQLWAEAYYMYKSNPDISKEVEEIDKMIRNQNNEI